MALLGGLLGQVLAAHSADMDTPPLTGLLYLLLFALLSCPGCFYALLFRPLRR